MQARQVTQSCVQKSVRAEGLSRAPNHGSSLQEHLEASGEGCALCGDGTGLRTVQRSEPRALSTVAGCSRRADGRVASSGSSVLRLGERGEQREEGLHH